MAVFWSYPFSTFLYPPWLPWELQNKALSLRGMFSTPYPLAYFTLCRLGYSLCAVNACLCLTLVNVVNSVLYWPYLLPLDIRDFLSVYVLKADLVSPVCIVSPVWSVKSLHTGHKLVDGHNLLEGMKFRDGANIPCVIRKQRLGKKEMKLYF